MSVLELKQELSRMSKRDRQETPEWKKAAARGVAEMKKGPVVSAAELLARIGARSNEGIPRGLFRVSRGVHPRLASAIVFMSWP
jgi:RNA polymerase-interacting CarD/CdnL/TRCF family regulator